MANSMHGDPRQTNTSTLLFSITKKAHLVENRRTDMSTRCWVETNSAQLSASTQIIAKSAKNNLRVKVLFSSLCKLLPTQCFAHVHFRLGYFLGLFCVRYLRILLSISLQSVESLIYLSQPHIVVKKIALSSCKEWYVDVFSSSLKIFFLSPTIQKLHLSSRSSAFLSL